jgi:hypothetical protein
MFSIISAIIRKEPDIAPADSINIFIFWLFIFALNAASCRFHKLCVSFCLPNALTGYHTPYYSVQFFGIAIVLNKAYPKNGLINLK